MPGPSTQQAYAIGRRHEEALGDEARRQGAHYTPPEVAELLVDRSLARWDDGRLPRVCDPSCGGGVFLVAAAEALVARGADPLDAVERLVVGVDIDPGAVAASAAALVAWAGAHGRRDARPNVVCADALDGDLAARIGPVDVVVGNPPFRNQLGGATARSAGERAALSARFGAAAGGYVDVAALFQLVGLDLVVAGGVVTLIQPRSFLVARDAAVVRDRALTGTALAAVWLPGAQLFEANVDVCATVLVVGRDAGDSPVEVWGGRAAEQLHGVVAGSELEGASTWSPLWATANGVPSVVAPSGRVVGDVATATAGFRDQYYGLLPHLRDDEPARGAPLVTTAMVEPGRCDWATRPVTVAKMRRRRPWVDLDALAAADPGVAGWVERLQVPKVLVATQTKVIEATADPSGVAVPMTPVIAVVPTGAVDPHRLEAALLAPAATAWALRRFGGAGMSAGALKLAAKQVLEIPLPNEEAPWDDAVACLAAEGAWREFGRLMNRSWGIDDDALLAWWVGRLGPASERSSDPRGVRYT